MVHVSFRLIDKLMKFWRALPFMYSRMVLWCYQSSHILNNRARKPCSREVNSTYISEAEPSELQQGPLLFLPFLIFKIGRLIKQPWGSCETWRGYCYKLFRTIATTIYLYHKFLGIHISPKMTFNVLSVSSVFYLSKAH